MDQAIPFNLYNFYFIIENSKEAVTKFGISTMYG